MLYFSVNFVYTHIIKSQSVDFLERKIIFPFLDLFSLEHVFKFYEHNRKPDDNSFELQSQKLLFPSKIKLHQW